MELNKENLDLISSQYGESFYILDTEQFVKNYNNLLGAFRKYYSNSHIAYSYKTNYTPRLCYLINSMGGFAEIVSDMEGEIAYKIGVNPSNIYFNGPYKNIDFVEKLLLDGGCVNIDSINELRAIIKIANKHKDKKLNIAIRLNFDIKSGILSRFGIDVCSLEFINVIEEIKNTPNLYLKGLHSHFASRNILYWPNRIKGLIEVIEKHFKGYCFEFIDLGGGLFGNMKESLKKQFDSVIPNYEDYAKSVCIEFDNYFKNYKNKPMLFIEPGTALAGDSMKFVSKVVNIKDVLGKKIATLLGSIYNINPTLNTKNPPITVVNMGNSTKYYENLDFVGFTCIESDYLYKNYNGNLAIGDYVIFENVGSYSVVLKPPFILPNFAVIEINEDKIEVVKRKECFDDLFKTYKFEFEG